MRFNLCRHLQRSNTASPPEPGNFAVVEGLRAAGARFVWLDCPLDVARRRYAKREGNAPRAMRAFAHQAALIAERWNDIVAIADPQIVPVLRAKAPRPHAELYGEIFGVIP